MSQPQFLKGQYFKGRIDRVEPSLDALFVYIGADKHGFLPLKDIANYNSSRHKVGAVLTVKIWREAQGHKGALLTAPGYVPTDEKVHDLLATAGPKRNLFVTTEQSAKSSTNFRLMAAMVVAAVVAVVYVDAFLQ